MEGTACGAVDLAVQQVVHQKARGHEGDKGGRDAKDCANIGAPGEGGLVPEGVEEDRGLADGEKRDDTRAKGEEDGKDAARGRGSFYRLSAGITAPPFMRIENEFCVVFQSTCSGAPLTKRFSRRVPSGIFQMKRQ